MIRIQTFNVQNRPAAIALLIVALGAVGLFFVVGLMLLAGLVVGGTALAAGLTIYHRLRGGRVSLPDEPSRSIGRLDPGLEVFPAESSEPRRLR